MSRLAVLATAIALLGFPAAAAAAQAQLSGFHGVIPVAGKMPEGERPDYDPKMSAQLIGRTFWIENPWGEGLQLCPSPSTKDEKECVQIAHTRFTIIRTVYELHTPDRPDYALVFYAIRLPDGRTGVTPGPRSQFHTVDPVIEKRAAATDCKTRGKPEMWMSREQIERTCWGKPSRVQKLTTQAGTKETLFYSTGSSIELHDGKVTTIAEQE